MTPAKESKPRMNETGPLAMPPPPSGSLELRRLERFVPVPDPPLKSIASVLARSMIEPMESWTELMKQALACWGTRLPSGSRTPRLNQTGELKHAFWWRSRCVSSSRNVCACSSSAK
jgi:hypothetical protein